LLEKKNGQESIEVADVMLSLAELLYKAGKVEEGREYFESMQKILKEQKNR
jgi:pentatricopeptide repeat protein